MKKSKDNFNIKNAIFFIIIGILICTPLVLSGAWPIALFVGSICSIGPIAVLLDKLGVIELVNVTKYKKIIDDKGNIIYDDTDEYEKSNYLDYEKELRFADDRKRINSVFEEPYKKTVITDKTREDVLKHPNLYTNSDVRTRMGKFYTDEEWEQRREDVLSKALPGEDDGPKLIKKWKPKKNK